MMKFSKLMFFASLLMVISCGDKESETEQLSLNISGLEDLGTGYAYEGWIMVDGSPKTTGVFTVNSNGALSKTTFDIGKEDLEKAAAFILTIEPSPDPDPAPSDVHILAGGFSGSSATLTVDHDAAIGTNFTSASGKYILATPTDGTDANEDAGVWFLDPMGPSATLSLPTLPAGWVYEGWAVINNTPVSTGVFTSPTGADRSSVYSGVNAGPPYPGEDFLNNAPSGLSFPTSLLGSTIVISVEPDPDNSPKPFLLKPLVGMAPANAAVHTLYDMANNATSTNPSGTASK